MAEQNSSERRWFKNPLGTPRAFALVIHGLNLRPSGMDPVVEELGRLGAEVMALCLKGHDEGEWSAFLEVQADDWARQGREALLEVKARSDAAGVPCWVIGYSLGGLVALSAAAGLGGGEGIRPDRLLLFAPALSLRPVAWVAQALTRFRVLDRIGIRSRAYPEMRAHWGTPLRGYRALFQLLEEFMKIPVDELRARIDVPTQVLISEEDDLVNAQGIRALVCQWELKNWQVRTLRCSGREGVGPCLHHLIVDPHTVGDSEWRRIWHEGAQFLAK